MNHVMRKPVFRGKKNWPAQLQRLGRVFEILILTSICVLLSRQQTRKDAQADLHLCCSHDIIRFSRDVSRLYLRYIY